MAKKIMPTQAKEIWHFLIQQTSVKIAIVGLIGAIIFSLIKGNPTVPASQSLANPSVSPYEKSISGNGYVEANTRNISVRPFSSGIVNRVFVKPGEHVKAEQPLFEMDKRSAETQIELDSAVVETARHKADAKEAQRLEAADQHQRAKKVKDGYISAEEAKKRELSLQELQSQSSAAKTELKEAEHKLHLSRIALDKLTIRAPVDGLVCKVNISPGEFVIDAYPPQGCIIMGNDTPLHVRVQIDEHDAWRLSANAPAIALLPGYNGASVPLTFIRIEPFAGTKKQLSGNSDDVVDTRVVEVIYAACENTSYPLYMGQQVDVFIEDKANKEQINE